MGKLIGAVFSLVLLSLAAAVPPAWGYWVPDGAAVCTAISDQSNSSIVSDGSGGAIVVWEDYRNGPSDVYAQRMNTLGVPQWAANGVAICAATYDQQFPTIVSDGAGGAIIAWRDARGGSTDIYAQRVNASGAVQWTANGVAICTAVGAQSAPRIAADGAGGAIITWQDLRNGSYDVYAQKVNASGAAQWTADGVSVCTSAGDQYYPIPVSDGSGGAILTWYDYRSGTSWDVYVQRMNAAGAAQWNPNGVALCALTGNQTYPAIVSDGSGGAIVAWEDYRSTFSDVYAQRINASGTLLWTTNGVAITSTTGEQRTVSIVSDGSGGAIVSWEDSRTGDWNIYAQRVNSTGTAQWTANGISVCSAPVFQYYPMLATDDAHGAIVTWWDLRNGATFDVYAQWVNAAGAAQWTTNGVALCTAAADQGSPMIAADGMGGAIVAWYDYRAGYYDIYAQSVDVHGKAGLLAPSIRAVRDVPGDQGGKVYLSWYGARADVYMTGDVSTYTIWRAISPTTATLALENGTPSIDDLRELDLSSGKPVIRMEKASGRTFFWELVEALDAMRMPGYGKPVATLFDSTAVCDEYTYFQVVAHTSSPSLFWKSEPDSGYSVDNLPPSSPASLAGEQSYAPAGLLLTWHRNTEADLGDYHVYRGVTAGFVPGPGNLIVSQCDTMLFDGDWRWSSGYYYKVAAVDVHGNESAYALFGPDNVTGAETPKTPEATYLAQNYPNPFNPATSIAFGLSAPGKVSLRIYDAGGRLVRVLVDEERSAGQYEERWDGRDSRGSAVASGIYFYRLSSGAFTETKKMALLR